MNETDLKNFRSFLLNQKSAILNKTTEFKTSQSVERTRLSDEAEAAQLDLTNNLSIRLQERDHTLLIQIENALAKIEAGTYGECESCGDEIGEKRLQARPFACLCISCMEEQEGAGRFLN